MNQSDSTLPPATRREVEERLKSLRAARGYLLPHHGLLAVATPDLLDAYDATYSTLTLERNHLGEQTKEFVWLTILGATRVSIGTHHIRRWRDSGGSDAKFEAALKLAAYAQGVSVFPFIQKHWSAHLPGRDTVQIYRDGINGVVGDMGIPTSWLELALASTHACLQQWWAFEIHVAGAYSAGASEGELAEALTFAMFHGGAPCFVNACDKWRRLILAGDVPATEPYRAWAEMPGQGGYDEAVGLTVQSG